MDNIIAALIGATVVIVISIISGNWHLSNKIGDLRVEIATLRAKEASNHSRVSVLWNRCFSERSCRVPVES